MSVWRKAHRCALALLILGLLGVSSAGAVTIDEFPLGATPTGITLGPDGNLYVTTTAPSILRVSPAGDVTARYPVPLNDSPQISLPTFSGDALWFAVWRNSAPATALGRRAADGSFTEFPVATPDYAINSLTPGTNGDVWFTQLHAGVSQMQASGATTNFFLSYTTWSVTTDVSGQLWLAQWTRSGSLFQLSASGSTTPAGVSLDLWNMAASRTAPVLWLAGREGLCCYGQDELDFAYRVTPGATGTRVGGGFLGSAILKDITVGPDDNAWMTDGKVPRIGRATATGRVDAFTDGLRPGATVDAITSGPGDTVWFTDPGGWVGRVTLDHPKVTTEPAFDIGDGSAALATTVTPLGNPARVRFEYGKTTDYGDTTRWQTAGDGDDPVHRVARIDALEPGTTYHYRAVVSTGFGVTAGPDHTFSTAPLPPPPPVPPADADGDGYATAVDCDDHSALTYPGADDLPGDGIDQDCSGSDAALPRFYPHIVAYWQNQRHRWSRFTTLLVEDVPAGAHLGLRCRGAGCRFKTASITAKRTLNADLLSRLRGSRLARDAVLELRLTLADHVGTVVRWTVGPPPRPRVTCLPPGARRDRPC